MDKKHYNSINFNQNLCKKDDLIDIIKPIKEGIDYAFKNHKNQIISKNKNKIDDYLFDIVQTWNINMELLGNFINCSEKFTKEQKDILVQKLNSLKALVENKKNLKQEKQKLSGKLLMDQQILEEFKRRNHENTAYFQEQLDEYKEILDKKDDFVKQLEKKFNEVQIYIQRQVKSNKNTKYEFLNNYEIINFINENENVTKTKHTVQEEIRNIRQDMNNLTLENTDLKKLNENNSTLIENESSTNNENNMQWKSIIQNYKKKIIKAEKRNREFRAKLESLKNQAKIKENKNYVEKEEKLQKEDKIESYNEKHKAEDISIIKDLNETNFNDLVVNKTNDCINRELWDISCIEKKGD